MADTVTANYAFVKPELKGSDNTWDAKLNGNFDALDAEIYSIEHPEVVALTGTTPNADLNLGEVFTLTTSGNTTFTFSNPVATGRVSAFTLRLTSGGAHTITWPASVDWPNASAPDAPLTGETDVLVFLTLDGGTTWLGFVAGNAVA